MQKNSIRSEKHKYNKSDLYFRFLCLASKEEEEFAESNSHNSARSPQYFDQK